MFVKENPDRKKKKNVTKSSASDVAGVLESPSKLKKNLEKTNKIHANNIKSYHVIS